MQPITNLYDLWQQYFSDAQRSRVVDDWTIVYFGYSQQSLLVSLANPFTLEQREIVIDPISNSDVQRFITLYKQRFVQTLDKRFGLFMPEVDSVLTEYPDWQTFYATWLNEDPQLMQANMPLLFDFPDSDAYRALQLKQMDRAGYQRLLIVLYQYRKQRFQKIFIKQVDDNQFITIKQLMLDDFRTMMPQLMYKPIGMAA